MSRCLDQLKTRSVRLAAVIPSVALLGQRLHYHDRTTQSHYKLHLPTTHKHTPPQPLPPQPTIAPAIVPDGGVVGAEEAVHASAVVHAVLQHHRVEDCGKFVHIDEGPQACLPWLHVAGCRCVYKALNPGPLSRLVTR
jgi:hypothetical protein